MASKLTGASTTPTSPKVVVKKRKISLVRERSKKKNTADKEHSTNAQVSQSKISSSFGLSLDSRGTHLNNESGLSKGNQPQKEAMEAIEQERKKEMELTDKPLKSVFLFENIKEMPINCSEKDSITYKIGRQGAS